MCVGRGALATVHIWKSARLLGVDSLSTMWVQGLNSGSQMWWQVFLLTETAPLYRLWMEWKVWIAKVAVGEAQKYE